MKMKFGHISTILFIIGIFSMVSGKEKIFCNQCENLIKEGASYIVSNGKIYCGDKCLSATWEKCSVCKKRVSKGIHYGNKNGVFFCLECSGKPLCFACGLPNDCSVLKDGRMICAKCEAKSISSFREAMNIIRDVRKKMKEKLKIYTNHDINYELVDLHTLKTISKNPEMELGLFSHEQWKNTETTYKSRLGIKYGEKINVVLTDSFYIYILTDMPKDKFIEITAHELAHDWMEEVYPNIKDLKITEGWAEFVASQINSIYKNEHLNTRMTENTNPVYGDGYRYIADFVKKNKFSGLYKLFRELNESGKKKGGYYHENNK